MAREREKDLAIELRLKDGLTYTEIIERFKEMGLKVSRGSLSNWLKHVPLTEQQKERIETIIEEGKAKGRSKINTKREVDS